jgi:plasmid replication initiation protein
MAINQNNLVLSNKLVQGRYQLTKEEQNFIYLVVSQINKEDVKFTEYQIHISDLESAELVQKKHSRYKDFARKLRAREIIIEDTKSILVTGWFADIEYMKNTGIIKATISEKLKPYLLQLKDEFVQAKLPTLLQFKSKYSSRLFLLLKSYYDRQKKHKKHLYIISDLEELHSIFELPISYSKVYSKFKNSFLLNSLEEIGKYTDLDVSYKELKTGRKITSIEFCISQKEKTESQLRKEIEQTKTLSDYLPNGLSNKTVSILLDEDLGFQKHDLKNIFEHYKIEDIEQICHELFNCWDSDKLMSRQGFFRGKLKLLNRRKTQNFDFGFDKLFDEKNKLK